MFHRPQEDVILNSYQKTFSMSSFLSNIAADWLFCIFGPSHLEEVQ